MGGHVCLKPHNSLRVRLLQHPYRYSEPYASATAQAVLEFSSGEKVLRQITLTQRMHNYEAVVVDPSPVFYHDTGPEGLRFEVLVRHRSDEKPDVSDFLYNGKPVRSEPCGSTVKRNIREDVVESKTSYKISNADFLKSTGAGASKTVILDFSVVIKSIDGGSTPRAIMSRVVVMAN